MTYACMRCSLQSEHEHTLCCAESARMYILHMRIKVLGKQNGQSGLWLLTPSIIHFKFTPHLLIALTSVYVTHVLKSILERVI